MTNGTKPAPAGARTEPQAGFEYDDMTSIKSSSTLSPWAIILLGVLGLGLIIFGFSQYATNLTDAREANQAVVVSDLEDLVGVIEGRLAAGDSAEEAVEFAQVVLPEGGAALVVGDDWVAHVSRDVKVLEHKEGHSMYDYGYVSSTGVYSEATLSELLRSL